jgi:hypothetical protein
LSELEVLTPDIHEAKCRSTGIGQTCPEAALLRAPGSRHTPCVRSEPWSEWSGCGTAARLRMRCAPGSPP